MSLVLLMLVFTVGYFFASLWRFQEFYGTNWDLGINMQLLWSNTHGHLLYAAGDYETGGLNSYLSIHSTYIAVPISYLYSIFPGAATLFALQAAAVATSALPLYLIGKKAGLREGWLVAGLGVYLLSFAINSALLYDFHWEAFLPAEFAWTFYLWNNRRYILAFLPAVIGVLTLEVYPFLLLGIVLYFGYLALRRFLTNPAPLARKLQGGFRKAWPLVGLLLFAVTSYLLVRIAQHTLISLLVGAPPLGLGSQATLGYQQVFSVTATSQSIPASLVYWFLLFAAFGFIPLLVRQSLLLLNVPWFWATVLITPKFSAAFGDQYAFVAVATISVAFIEGLAFVRKSAQENEKGALLPIEWLVVVVPFFVIALLFSPELLAPTPIGEDLLLVTAAFVAGVLVVMWFSVRNVGRSPRVFWRRGDEFQSLENRISDRQRPQSVALMPRAAASTRRIGSTWARGNAGFVLGGVLVLVIVSNLALSPYNAANFEATVFPGYQFSFSSSPAYSYVGGIAASIPANAQVVASDNLFPFVADDVNAYSLAWSASILIPFLPFNSTHLPRYVLVSTSQWGDVPTFLKDSIFNQSEYGIVALIYCASYPGSIYLFAMGYEGATKVVQATPFSNSIILCPSSLVVGPSGVLESAGGTECGSEIESIPASNLSGNGHTIWYGPYITLLPGFYNITMSIKGGLYAGKPPNADVAFVNGNGYGATSTWYAFNLNASILKTNSWTSITAQFNVTHPVAEAEFRGYLDYSATSSPPGAYGFIDLNFIQLARYVSIS
jgi:uncharacterized membrane protein